MDRSLNKLADTTHQLKLLLVALGIDVFPALFFLHTLILYKYQSHDVDLERFVDVTITPIFNGMNFLLIIILYVILSRKYLPWYITLAIPIGVFIFSYPALYLGAHITTLFSFRFPEQELTSMRVFSGCGWLIATLLGTVWTAAVMHRQSSAL
jgi:hypothetical protein